MRPAFLKYDLGRGRVTKFGLCTSFKHPYAKKLLAYLSQIIARILIHYIDDYRLERHLDNRLELQHRYYFCGRGGRR